MTLSSVHVYTKDWVCCIDQFSFELNTELGPDHVVQWLSMFLAHGRDLGSFSMRQVIYSSLNILRSLFHPQSEFVLLQVSGICFKSLPYMSYTVLDEVAVELENSVC